MHLNPHHLRPFSSPLVSLNRLHLSVTDEESPKHVSLLVTLTNKFVSASQYPADIQGQTLSSFHKWERAPEDFPEIVHVKFEVYIM